MLVLITNDDSIYADGINALADEIDGRGRGLELDRLQVKHQHQAIGQGEHRPRAQGIDGHVDPISKGLPVDTELGAALTAADAYGAAGETREQERLAADERVA